MKRKWNKGFTMAEVMIVVAIIMVLAAVSFVGVQRYQRSLYHLEFDGIAREIYFAAQNHLTQADSQGLVAKVADGESGLNISDFKIKETDTNPVADIYYCTYPDGGNEMLGLMLPQFSVDVNSSLGPGTFCILYQKSTATVLDVFYTSLDNRFGSHGTKFKDVDFNDVLKGLRDTGETSKRNDRRSVSGVNGAILGYYGGENAQEERITLKAPELKVENADKLRVIVTNPNTAEKEAKHATLQLIVKGVTSTKEMTIPLVHPDSSGSSTPSLSNEKTYVKDITKTGDPACSVIEIVLDDIAVSGGHFAEKFTEFIPGEDITIQVKAFSANSYANIAWSAVATTNSLFADPYPYPTGTDQTVLGTDISKNAAGIANFRHLENLDAKISRLGMNNKDGAKIEIKEAYQMMNIDWTEFNNNTPKVVPLIGTEQAGGLFWPVSPSENKTGDTTDTIVLAYDGQNHSVSNVTVQIAGDAGLFGTLKEDSSVKNLLSIDHDITSTGTSTSTSTDGNAGGLVGTLKRGTIEKCAATGVVKTNAADGSAGGLIGAVTETGTTTTTIRYSYSGGHTKDGSYAKWLDNGTTDNSDDHPYDVTGATAGGLIGSAVSATISSCYSTCSVDGNTTGGGFIGTAGSNVAVTNSYCTGLVSGGFVSNKLIENAFLGSGSLSSSSGNLYFEIINEVVEKDTAGKVKSIQYKGPGDSSVKALDATAGDYNTFVGPQSDWGPADPKDPYLQSHYKDSNTNKYLYNLKSVRRLASSAVNDTDIVATHYGDWPAPEIFIVNTP